MRRRGRREVVFASGPVRGGERGAKLALPDVFDVVGTPPDVLGTPSDVLGTRVHLAQIRRPQPPEPSRQLVARVAGPVFRNVLELSRIVRGVYVRSTLARLAAASGARLTTGAGVGRLRA